jgi:ferritin
MIGEKMEAALNLQMNREFFNSRLYLAMAAYFDSLDLEGATQWMELQSEEERGHAMRIYEHLKERGARPVVSELEAPPKEWDSPLAAFEAAYEHECNVSREFDEHMELAEQEKDNATKMFLQWFIEEQVEEEDSVNSIIQKLKHVEGAPGGMFMMDRMLGERQAGAEEPEGEEA